jgi:hypothetical protein
LTRQNKTQLKEEESVLQEQKGRLKGEIVRVKQSQDEVSEAVELAAASESEEDSITRRNLILIIDSLRKDKMSFKKQARDEKAKLDARIDELKSAQTNESDDQQEEREVEELKQIYEKQQDKLNKITGLYAQVCRDVSRFQRRLDDIPSRPEVTQYQRRFVELYDQIASKHVEAKKCYILYNQLDDTRIQLEKEFNLLTSVLDSFKL